MQISRSIERNGVSEADEAPSAHGLETSTDEDPFSDGQDSSVQDVRHRYARRLPLVMILLGIGLLESHTDAYMVAKEVHPSQVQCHLFQRGLT